ncbi:hypothetical protein Bca101_092186 [Brassica carinata]
MDDQFILYMLQHLATSKQLTFTMEPASKDGIHRIQSILAMIDYGGLDHVMMAACGGLLPRFWQVINQAVKLERKKGGVGMVLGVACAVTAILHPKKIRY